MKEADRQIVDQALAESRAALETYTYGGLHNESPEEEWKEADEKAKKAVDLCQQALKQMHASRPRKRKGTVAANPQFIPTWEALQLAMGTLLRYCHTYGAPDLFYIWVDEVMARVQDISMLEPMTPAEVETLYCEQAKADAATAAAEGIGATRITADPPPVSGECRRCGQPTAFTATCMGCSKTYNGGPGNDYCVVDGILHRIQRDLKGLEIGSRAVECCGGDIEFDYEPLCSYCEHMESKDD